MEVDGGTDDRWLRYADVCDNISNSIDDFKADLLSVTPQPKTGHWIYDKSIANWICSKCGETPKTIGYVGTGAFMAEHFKYCNHCGAEMEGSEEV
jgi:ribosomal protein S27AE